MKQLVKKISSLIVVMAMLVAFCVPAYGLGYGEEWAGYQDANTKKYTDVPQEHWAYDSIQQASQKNWFGGYPDGSFRPNGSITRAEALKVFVVFLGIDYQSVDLSNLTYYDVSTNDWFAPYIEAGKDLFPSHTTIQGKRPFNPNMPVTREDTIYALVKALGCDNGVKYTDQSVLEMFSDKGSISEDLKAQFTVALQHELVSGFPDGTIRAQAPLTRAEFATLLLRGTKHGFHDNYEAKINSVKVMPASPVEIQIGESITMTARATYSDGSEKSYSALSPYVESGSDVISLNGTTFTGLKEGNAVIKYNDSYLKNESMNVTVKKPTDAPKLKITDYPETTELNKVNITGFVTDSNIAGVDVTCNNKDVKLDGEGNFNTEVALNVGANEFKFTATNQYGASDEKTITITRTDSPILKITKYKERTTEKSTEVKGVVEYHDLSAIRVDCNGANVAFGADGQFAIDVDLKMGKNPFLFTAITNSGSKVEQAIVIRRYELLEPEKEPEKPAVKPEKKIFTWDWMDTIPTTTQYNSVEAVLVIDDSGSLGGDYGYDSSTGRFMGGTDPAHKRLEVARDFVSKAHAKTKIGIVKFDSDVEILTNGLVTCNVNGQQQLKDLLQINNGTFDSRGTTKMYSGINAGFDLFESNDPEVMKVMIVFSDGIAHDTELHAQTLLEASSRDITIYSVGLGSSNSSYFEEYMKPLATNTGGAFYMADNAENLKGIFEAITVRIDTVTDSDNDGIADYYEDTLRDENGNAMNIDKSNPDTDGDGIGDGEEIRLEFEYNADNTKVRVTAFMSSDPTKADTDGDGKPDKDDAFPMDANN